MPEETAAAETVAGSGGMREKPAHSMQAALHLSKQITGRWEEKVPPTAVIWLVIWPFRLPNIY